MAALPVTRNSQEGFTLIEVMIAMVLTAIAIMGIIALYVTETKASGFSRHSTEAAVLAQDRLERQRTIAPAAAGVFTDTNINERGAAGGIYTRVATETLQANWADIVVVVTWSDDGIAHTVTMNARRGL
jgi:prepilin-type N-terminal cleavage/methylation domain-containing protein